MIRVLIADDSAVVREFLRELLEADPGISVIAMAGDGKEAVRLAQIEKPDVITMDIHMPWVDGIEATRRIMEATPAPIVIVSDHWNPEAVATTFKAIEAGAVAIMEKPVGLGHPEYKESARKFVQTVKAMSGVRVVRRWSKPTVAVASKAAEVETAGRRQDIEIIAMGASIGGPAVIQTILKSLSKDLPVPMLICQHIAHGFLQGLADWLRSTTGYPVSVPYQGEQLLAGRAYVAPDGFHLGVQRGGRVRLSASEPENGLRPAVSYLFRSVARVYGPNAVGVLLTGMGRDGAEEMKLMRDLGAVTIAQDKESSVVHGMPGEAIRLEAASLVLAPDRIVDTLERLVKR